MQSSSEDPLPTFNGAQGQPKPQPAMPRADNSKYVANRRCHWLKYVATQFRVVRATPIRGAHDRRSRQGNINVPLGAESWHLKKEAIRTGAQTRQQVTFGDTNGSPNRGLANSFVAPAVDRVSEWLYVQCPNHQLTLPTWSVSPAVPPE
mmetsp:Transcript_5734/g.8127  ORF Transcript_5734/g.8127 Transcript_5734/m.8127 type:complete len:149 (+) Transcript_5734:1701-2147(+)